MDRPDQLIFQIGITLMGVTHNIELTLPFHWQLLWLSSLSFVIALGLFKLFCPKFVQKYSSFSEYSSYNNHPRWLAWEAHSLLKSANINQKKKLVERLSKKKYLTKLEVNLDKDLCDEPKVNEKQTVIKFRVDGQSYEFGMPIVQTTHDENSEKDVFYELFGRYSESYYAVRYTIKILLIISLVLFLWVLGQHICNGAGFIWEWILEVRNK